jgi:hypothetical protein
MKDIPKRPFTVISVRNLTVDSILYAVNLYNILGTHKRRGIS